MEVVLDGDWAAGILHKSFPVFTPGFCGRHRESIYILL